MAHEDTLAKVWIFSKLERSDIKRIAKAIVSRTFRKGDTVVNEGDTAVAFYVVVSGSLSITKDGKPLGAVGPGDPFGEMGLLDGYPRTATLTALEDTECLVMTRWDFNAELNTNPSIALAMLPELSKRIRRLEGEDIP